MYFMSRRRVGKSPQGRLLRFQHSLKQYVTVHIDNA